MQTAKRHPWFFYAGGFINFSDGNYNVSVNGSIGSYLLKDRWDLALTGSVMSNDNDVSESTTTSIGISSKVYYPIREYNISPYIGAMLSQSSTNTKTSESGNSKSSNTNKMLLLGVSWYVGPGSWDFGMQFGDAFNFTFGYTFSF
ncbi:MAG: hypothetical protein LBI03_08340 [Clostridiales bacterium]|jgi:hypothetical protein|nr:hypothetical protein [Clostridiales bacterium]